MDELILQGVPISRVELCGPFECPGCGGHFMLDGSYLSQVDNNTGTGSDITCPYCKKALTYHDDKTKEVWLNLSMMSKEKQKKYNNLFNKEIVELVQGISDGKTYLVTCEGKIYKLFDEMEE